MNGAQLPLAMRWPQQQRFDSYHVGDNGVAIEALRRAASRVDADWVFLSGPPAAGKTHLLIAACAAATAAHRRAQYVSLRSARTGVGATTAQAEMIRTLGGSELLAIDDIEAIAANGGAELALFDLYNRCKAENTTLILAAAQPPAQTAITLPDLVSRLSTCVQAPLKPLADGQRREVVRARAEARGVVLDDNALDWMFTHTQRDLASLGALIDRIDRASLAAKRRITVPFLRELVLHEAVGGEGEDG